MFSLPIIHNAAEPEKNKINVFIAFFIVFLTYTSVGTLGYFAFSGQLFKEIFESQESQQGVITQNFLSMFYYDQIPAIFIRVVIYCQLTCSLPLSNHFFRSLLMDMVYKNNDFEALGKTKFRLLNLSILIAPLGFSLFYPKVGSILVYASSLSGFFLIYVVPVVTYMKMKKLEITDPLIARALQENDSNFVVSL